MTKTIFITLSLFFSTFMVFGQAWVDVTVRNRQSFSESLEKSTEELRRQNEQQQERLFQQRMQFFELQRQDQQQRHQKLKEEARQKVMLLQEYYHSIQSHPEKISDGWHDVIETDGNIYIQNAKVYVLNNQITKYINWAGKERKVLRPATIDKSKTIIRLEQQQGYIFNILYIYFLS